MAKTVAPLLSFSAGGAIAKTQVYSTWRGIPYVRRYVIPANPDTSGQQETRGSFKWLTQVYKRLSSDAIAPWLAFATGQPLTATNAFIKSNLPVLRGQTTTDAFVGSPGALGGAPLTSLTNSVATGVITSTPVPPTPPTGWTVSKVVGVLMQSVDSQTSTVYVSTTESASSSPWTLTFPSQSAGDYIVTAWPVYTRPDGQLAYGPSLTEPATVT